MEPSHKTNCLLFFLKFVFCPDFEDILSANILCIILESPEKLCVASKIGANLNFRRVMVIYGVIVVNSHQSFSTKRTISQKLKSENCFFIGENTCFFSKILPIFLDHKLKLTTFEGVFMFLHLENWIYVPS